MWLTVRASVFCAVLSALFPTQIIAQPFVVADVRIEGLQRIAAGSVFSYLPVKSGQTIDIDNDNHLIKDLFASGLFADISLLRDGNVLVVRVKEFPVIAAINIEGNKDIKEDDIRAALLAVGLGEGRNFNPATLKQMTQELTKQYQANSKYAARIETNIENLPRGRVAINLKISEGRAARIKDINFVGNKAYSNARLMKLFDSSSTRWNSFITKSDQYNNQKLAADFERLESFYQDRGFIDFKITSNQITLSPDNLWIYLNVNLEEGELYTVADYQLQGDSIVDSAEIENLIVLKKGELYNRSLLRASVNAIKARLADEGYAQTEVQVVPHKDLIAKNVTLDFVIIPGNKTYVRFIEFSGNDKTHDRVLRRELRQQESGIYSGAGILRSEERLRRLPQIEQLQMSVHPVKDKPDQVDIKYDIKERSTSYVQLGLGYGEISGALFNIQYNDNNFFGTGNSIALKVGRGENNENYSFKFTDPYLNADGLSISYDFHFNKYNYDEKNELSEWSTDDYGALVTLGYPIDEYQKVYFGGGYRGIGINTGKHVATEISDYVAEHGSKFHEAVVNASWSKDSRDSLLMPNKGSLNSVTAEVALSGSDNYYKLAYHNSSFFNFGNNNLILGLRGNIGYGDSFNDDDGLPFYRHYYAGGVNTIRGFKYGSVGPRYANGDFAGGDLRINGGIDLMLPWSFDQRSNDLRAGLFTDFGSSYKSLDDFSFDDLRYSSGIFVRWLSPIGALNLSYAIPLNEKDGDKTENFQFTLGAGL